MKNNILNLGKFLLQGVVFVLFITLMASCGKDAIKYKLNNETYSVECLRCGKDTTILNPGSINADSLISSKIRVSFEVEKGNMSKINEGSYVNVSYLNPNGTSGGYHVNYSDLKIEGKTISFLTDWLWKSSAYITVEARLYNDKDQKSEVAKIHILKPEGAD